MQKYFSKVKPIFETIGSCFRRAEFFLELAFAFFYILPAFSG